MDPRSELRALIAAVRRRWFRLVALRTAGRVAAAAALPLLAVAVLDYVAAPRTAVLIGMVITAAIASLIGIAVIVWRMQRRPDDRRVARFVEERAAVLSQDSGRGDPADLDDAIVSAVAVADAPPATEPFSLAPLLLASAVRRLRDLDPAMVIPTRSLRKAAGGAAGGAACLVLAVGLGAPAMHRAIESARLRYFPRSIAVSVTPGDARVRAGAPLEIRATFRDGERALTALAPALTVTAGGGTRTVEMTRAGDGFTYAFTAVDRSFEYTVAAGAATSARYRVTALVPPAVRGIDVHYTFPAFTGLPPRDERDAGDIYAPAGTRVRLRIHTDKPAASGALALGSRALALSGAGDRTFEGEMVLREDGAYRVTLIDADGLRSTSPTEYFIRVMDDRPPDVRIVRPSSDQEITPLEEVAIEARADDDYGVAAFDLVFSVAGGAERVVPFDRVTGTSIQKTGARLLPAEDLGVAPGDVIAYYARAHDVGRGRPSREVRSDIFFLEVKPFTEEFVAAQSQAGGGAAGEVDGLVDAQKAIISATWNIERRSGGGRSQEDIAAVAQAQADLKAKAEEMAARAARGRPRGPAMRLADQGRPPQRPAGADPMAAAVEAMSKAMQQLQGQKTKDAIPHEMAALNGLLQAQAEIRRRQVSQSTAGGGGGGNRSGQDLSALFDKELQRQQRTNYETRAPVEERPNQAAPTGDMSDRVRELAKRQEDLSQRQRELGATGLAAEEMKRQLEKLAREQTELREQLQQLARELPRSGGPQPQGRGGQQAGAQGGQQPSPGGRGGQSPGASGQGGSQVQEASDQMQSAAGELRRDDPNGAAQRGERAARELRRLEQQMRGGAAAGTAAGRDLQLEAQQIAQEQRRIAAEADRLAQGQGQGSAVAEAMKRLAAEQDRLAGRVDDLQRSAERLAAVGSDAAGRATDAARTLAQERLGQRMREGAAQMRGGTPDKARAAAQAEQQVARALDRVVDALGGGAAGDGRQLTDELERTRALRDRLNRLERQLRDAEVRAQNGAPGRDGSGRAGQPGGRGGSAAGDVDRLRQQYERELSAAREALGKLAEGQASTGEGGGTPEQQEFSRSAPGTEAFKQDRSGWESLRKDFDLALEKYEASVSSRRPRPASDDRFSAGGSERVPDSYSRLIARYYQALARARK